MTKKSLLMGILLLCCCIRAVAQTVKIQVDIEDEFLKMPLSGVKLSVLTPDSAVVVDSASCISATNAENQQIAKQTPSFTPKNVKSVFLFYLR